MATFEIVHVELTASDDSHTITVPVYAEIVAPGLAIAPEIGGDIDNGPQYEGGYALTHTASGKSVAGVSAIGGHCIACIRNYAEAAINSGIDWTKPMDAVQAAVKAGGEGIEAFKRAYVELSGCGGTDCVEVDDF